MALNCDEHHAWLKHVSLILPCCVYPTYLFVVCHSGNRFLSCGGLSCTNPNQLGLSQEVAHPAFTPPPLPSYRPFIHYISIPHVSRTSRYATILVPASILVPFPYQSSKELCLFLPLLSPCLTFPFPVCSLAVPFASPPLPSPACQLYSQIHTSSRIPSSCHLFPHPGQGWRQQARVLCSSLPTPLLRRQRRLRQQRQ